MLAPGILLRVGHHRPGGNRNTALVGHARAITCGEIVFGRRIITGKQRAAQGTFKTKVIARGTEVTINAFYRHSRIKQYLKDGRALRIETVINLAHRPADRPPPAQPGRPAGRRACDQHPAAAH